MFWAAAGSKVRRLDGKNSLPVLSELLVVNTGQLPRGLSPSDLATAIRELTVSPRCYVAKSGLRTSFARFVGDWGWTERDKERFSTYCTDPVLTEGTGPSWSLMFNCFNIVDGSIEAWTCHGDLKQIHKADKVVVDGPGALVWPISD